mmetsp:Transcript_3536/g.9950  ORF Transcript_3536/g.9950 Transcript_3536/m.9950 type:complete len:84 (-) Transcript_3536:326-577(-)
MASSQFFSLARGCCHGCIEIKRRKELLRDQSLGLQSNRIESNPNAKTTLGLWVDDAPTVDPIALVRNQDRTLARSILLSAIAI